jgi:hypothetical protein
MPDDQEPEQETPFNMAMIYYINLNKLIEAKDKAYMDNNLQLWYKGLDRIFNKICFKLTTGEREETDALFISARKQFKADINQVSFILRKIDFSLVAFMAKYKMIFPKIDGLRGLDKLYKRYGLKDKPEASSDKQ